MDRILYHFPLSPFSRKVRLMLAEKELRFDLEVENFWERRRKFLAINPAAQVPVLVETDESGVSHMFSESTAICEYLDEAYTERNLMGETPLERAEVRRISGWFNNKFYYEVTKYILDEKVFKYLKKQGQPNSIYIRAAKQNIRDHLDYISFLLKTRKWLAGEKFSMADITAASQLSVLDFLGDVPWEYNSEAKDWYCIIKSRPSFRQFFDDYLSGFEASKYYKELDF